MLIKIIRRIFKAILYRITNKRYAIGKFKLSGEVHQWMYDKFSLSRLLRKINFKSIKICDASTSNIDNWKNFNLDTEPNGKVYKKYSLFIEAVK